MTMNKPSFGKAFSTKCSSSDIEPPMVWIGRREDDYRSYQYQEPTVPVPTLGPYRCGLKCESKLVIRFGALRLLMRHTTRTFALIFHIVVISVVAGKADDPLTNGLIGYYPFNGNANDESGNGRHGVVHGATLASDRFGRTARAYHFDDLDAGILL
jgi:hypothetical protein